MTAHTALPRHMHWIESNKGEIVMKKFLSLVLAALLVLSSVSALADGITIAVPNDPTN